MCPRKMFFKRASNQTSLKIFLCHGSCSPQLTSLLFEDIPAPKIPKTDIYFCMITKIIFRYQIQKRGINIKQFARIAGGWFLGAQIFFAAPYTWFERLVPSQGKATKKSGEYEGMVEHIQNLGYLPQIIHTGTLQF